MKRILASAVFTLALGVAASAEAGQTLDNIKSKGVLTCGVNEGTAGFGLADSTGKYTGLDIDVCKAVATAILGSPDKIKFVPLSAPQRFTALQSGEVDILSRNTTWTLTREADLGLLFGPVTFYDGQGFLVKKSLNVKSAKQLSGATVCVQPGTTTELNLADYFRANKMELKPVVIEKLDEVENAFFSGRCDAYTTDSSGLAGTRVTKAQKPDDYIILPELISKEPLAPAVRQGDDQFYDIMRWSVFALLQAEEKGITSQNVDQMLKSEDPDIKRFLGVTPGNGKALGLDEKWAYNIIKSVGNYGEIFDRNVGKNSPLKLERGLNDLWTTGGLMYAPPPR
ncbi:amino acid ABC transporter substrate-binding protein [Aliidongia dinghuensis]|uniref:amino acid ABC transporter substrate-binding protein n=1 Tax=Aliidongia dinghuensis TaxID=1867774 RepID=UPI00166DFEDE|nr:amino acid ABC transporter substrate-binding protein [Aliidongia dinghuensis]